jgi:hypothetical protein
MFAMVPGTPARESTVEARGNPPFEREGIGGGEHADRCGGRPERERLVLEDETTDGRTDEEADLPGGAREGHVAPEELRFREVDHERRIDRAVQALRKREDTYGNAEDDRSLRTREPGAAGEDSEERTRPDDTHQGQAPQPALAFHEFHHRQLADRHAGGEDKPDHSDCRLTHVGGVLGEGREELAHHGNAGADQDHVEDDEGDEDAVPRDVRIASRRASRFTVARRRHELQHSHEHEERHRIEEEEEGEGAGMGRARNGAGDKRPEREANVHRHPLLRKGCVTTMWRCQRAEQCGLTGPEGPGGDPDEEVQHERVPGLANQREQREGDGGDHEGAAEHDTGPEPVRERAADEARGKCSEGTGRHDKAGNAEREPANVVQVDDQKRPDDAVPEHVREPARLKDPDVPRKLRIQAAKVGAHRARA